MGGVFSVFCQCLSSEEEETEGPQVSPTTEEQLKLRAQAAAAAEARRSNFKQVTISLGL
jgi:hypothetical protein